MNTISPDFVKSYKLKTPPWGPLGYIVYKRTYSRQVEGQERSEEWWETIERCVNGLLKIGGVFTREEIEKLYDHVFNLRCSFSGRALWQLGTETVDKMGGDSLQNCWCVNVDSPIHAFCFVFNELMLGGGVGFNITPESVYELPKVKFKPKIQRVNANDVSFIVPDNREGWVALLGKVLKAFFFTGKDFTYSTNCIRSKGLPIRGFGGIASGSENLVSGISQIILILGNRFNKKLRPVDCLDIMNVIGSIVVAGNIRRSAEIALGSPQDNLFINAKNWSLQDVPNYRAMSNNSLIIQDIGELSDSFWELYSGIGEPLGLVNLYNCQNFGRLVDGIGYREDSRVIGVNPCGEVPLESFEACNLAEIFLPNIKTVDSFKEVARLLYKVCKTIAKLPFIDEETNKVVKRNRRIGIGISGLLQSDFRGNVEVFNEVYKELESVDEEYSKVLKCPESIKLTTVKPSGTLSLLAGVTPGAHPAFAPYFIRRIRMQSGDPLVSICRINGYHVEPVINFDGTKDMNAMVVSFPIKSSDKAVCANQLTAIDQLENLKWLQRYWADNSVSITVYYKQQELSDIKEWLKTNFNEIKSVSFLLSTGHGFVQPPYEEITQDKYYELAGKVKDIVSVGGETGFGIENSLECSTSCPIK